MSKRKFVGTLESKVGSGIRSCCIAPEARDLLDRIMEEWERHKAKLPETVTLAGEVRKPRESIYGFACWLVRHSGLIQPAEGKEATSGKPKG